MYYDHNGWTPEVHFIFIFMLGVRGIEDVLHIADQFALLAIDYYKKVSGTTNLLAG